jgi:hypothetical protein
VEIRGRREEDREMLRPTSRTARDVATAAAPGHEATAAEGA